MSNELALSHLAPANTRAHVVDKVSGILPPGPESTEYVTGDTLVLLGHFPSDLGSIK